MPFLSPLRSVCTMAGVTLPAAVIIVFSHDFSTSFRLNSENKKAARVRRQPARTLTARFLPSPYIRRHCDRTDPEDNQNLTAFLHYYEPTLNRIVSGFILRYAMLGHFEDLKQEAVIGILEAASDYDYAKKKSFHNFTARSTENRMHDYTRRMRRGCTVESDYAYDRVRRVMAVFNRLGGHADMETLLAVSKEAGISVIEAEEMIHAALRNMQCMDIYRSYGLYDGEAEESREEITISPYPEPYEAFLEECQAKALCAAWESLDFREQEMLAAHLGFCPDCFGVLERTGHSEKWYDCVPRKKLPYKDIAISHGLSSPDSAQRICDHAIAKLRFIYEETYFRLLCLQS